MKTAKPYSNFQKAMLALLEDGACTGKLVDSGATDALLMLTRVVSKDSPATILKFLMAQEEESCTMNI